MGKHLYQRILEYRHDSLHGDILGPVSARVLVHVWAKFWGSMEPREGRFICVHKLDEVVAAVDLCAVCVFAYFGGGAAR
ncbi:uncharacterized protein ATNIH1004_001633 [Aspergillus tanneri]|uniref:Uncharacterized protein n=1 Tax=Aspergillus tanneri TaxID=1220188 RepID=A0A5M9N0W0_9EURO|nr:uncharacterized protein ATNIH1004_001633 [Aspergillus tanneri]KAA8652728.1 hypothetical protein ATNIH1004_001633 [Aspergillus tanneri]